MNTDAIYKVINIILDDYIESGIKATDLLEYLNASEENYKFIYNKLYRKLTIDNIQFDSDIAHACLKDAIRDRAMMLKDINK